MTLSDGRVRIWDASVRLFHWLIVVLVPLMWWTAEQHHMDWHRRIGLAIVFLVSYRLIWGLAGPVTARFAPMVRRLGGLVGYVRSVTQPPHKSGLGASFGHNPLGILSVFALITALSVQATTGLFSSDVDGLVSGPLSVWISFDLSRQFSEIHETNFNILVGLIALHIAAIAVHRFYLRENLIGPMLTGQRAVKDFAPHEVKSVQISWVRFVISAGLAGALVWGINSVA